MKRSQEKCLKSKKNGENSRWTKGKKEVVWQVNIFLYSTDNLGETESDHVGFC